LDAILDLTVFRYSDFGRFLVCYSPPQTVPETVKKPLLAIFWGSTLFCRISTRLLTQGLNYRSACDTVLLFDAPSSGNPSDNRIELISPECPETYILCYSFTADSIYDIIRSSIARFRAVLSGHQNKQTHGMQIPIVELAQNGLPRFKLIQVHLCMCH